MWVFLNDAFLSIVAHAEQPEMLLVRARFPADLERFCPDAEVTETPDRDYRFRTVLPRRQVADLLAERCQEIDYGNFKASVHERGRHDLYAKVWSLMWSEQNTPRFVRR